jgi:hypothetical protein
MASKAGGVKQTDFSAHRPPLAAQTLDKHFGHNSIYGDGVLRIIVGMGRVFGAFQCLAGLG